MTIVLTWQRSAPGQPQYGLATLTEHYKVQNDDGSQITAAAVLNSGGVPQQGDAHPDYPFMFCTDRYCAETGESASALDITYMGVLGGTHEVTLNDPGVDYVIGDQLAIASGGELAGINVDSVGAGGEIEIFSVFYNNFTTSHSALSAMNVAGSGLGSGATFDVAATAFELPPGQNRTGNPVQTATTFASDGTTQVTVQFYAVLSSFTWITYNAPGTTGSAPAPSGTPTVISFTVGNASFAAGESELLSLFQLAETDIVDSTEIVEGKYWQNTENRTLYYGANLTVCHPFAARAVCLFHGGSGYSISDTLTCTDGMANTAVMVVTAIGGGGSVTDFSITSDDISASIFEVIVSTGGGGSDCSFRFYGA